MTRNRRITAWLSVLGILGIVVAPACGDDDAGVRLFETKIRPVLAGNCFGCHGPDSGKGKAGLRIDSLESLRRGGNSGPAIVPGDPDASLLILAVRHDSSVAAMPPKSKLQPGELEALAAWVKMGVAVAHRGDRSGRAEDVGHRIRRQVGRGDARVLGLPAFEDPAGPKSHRPELAAHAHRPVHSFEARRVPAESGDPGRQEDTDPKGDARPARAAT